MPDVVLKIQFEQIESNSGIHSFPPSRGVTSLVLRDASRQDSRIRGKRKKMQSLVSLRAKSSSRNRSVRGGP